MTLPKKWAELEVQRLSHGGYLVVAPEWNLRSQGTVALPPLAGFSTLEEALYFVRNNIVSDEKTPL